LGCALCGALGGLLRVLLAVVASGKNSKHHQSNQRQGKDSGEFHSANSPLLIF
jgi:hypothetical protein